jgi:molecular chaperone HtpG
MDSSSSMDTFTLTADTAQTISALYKQAADPQPIEEICLVVNELIKNSENAILWLKNIERDITRDHRITIAFNRTKRTITVTDTGIGMNKSELISFLGILGKSGTRTYRDNTPDTIPFQGSCEGVGFYSVFLIAAKVQVYSKSEDSVHVWEWKREKNFTIDTADPSCLERGTRVTVYLKDDLLVENVETIEAEILADRDENRRSLLSFNFVRTLLSYPFSLSLS